MTRQTEGSMSVRSAQGKVRGSFIAIHGLCASLTSLGLLVAIGLFDSAAVVSAQDGFQRVQEAQALGAVVLDERTAEDFEALRKENNEKYGGGAPLKTDPELEELLRRAQMFADEASYRNATLLWQKVLSDSGDSLITRDGETYFSMSTEVEDMISRLPVDGLRQYRVTADGEARAAMASAATTEEGMHIVVRQFFLSSFGDDAAFYLGSLALDRYDFLNAQRMFRKIIEHYPDPSVSMPDVWLRLAVAAARVGDKETARTALEQANNIGRGIDANILTMVSADIDTAPNQLLIDAETTKNDWSMDMGGPSRKGVMPGLPQSVMTSDLASIWAYEFPVDIRGSASTTPTGSTLARRADFAITNRVEPVEQNQSAVRLIDVWRKNLWQPQGRMLVVGDRVIFKTNNDLVCWDINTQAEVPAWRSLWLNAYQQDEASFKMQQMYNAYGMANNNSRPAQPSEVMFFGDTIHHSMCVVGDMVINLEGKNFSRYGGSPPVQQNQGGYQWGTVPRRSRTNWLTAYDLKSGKLLWHTEAKPVMFEEYLDDDVEPISEGGLGFMAAPIPFGRLLLVPVSDGGAIWLYALDADNQGEVVWSSYLCDEPVGGSANWSPIGMALEGRDLYVVCGTGVVFSVDASSGAIRFARRYKRDGTENEQMRQYGRGSAMLDLDGWQEDMIIPFGNRLVVMASDHDDLFALDRQTGDVKWRAPRAPFDDEAKYCMGFFENKIYCAGPKTVICYDLAGEGRLAWAYRIEGNAYGRGMVTEDGVYVPIDESIVKLDLETGKPVKQVGVRLPSSAPVGNLFSDGKRIWTVSMNQVFALGNLEQQIELLTRSIDAGDVNAMQQRAGLLIKSNRIDEGMADLDRMYRAVRSESDATAATTRLLDAYKKIELYEKQPRAAMQQLVSFGTDAATQPDTAIDSQVLASQSHQLELAIDALRSQPSEADLALLLSVIERLNVSSLQPGIRSVLSENQERLPLEMVVAMSTSSNQEVVTFALPILASLNDARVVEIATPLLSSDNEEVNLIAARAISELGERTGIETIVKLLESDEIKMRAMAAQTLRDLTGNDFAFDPLGQDADRAEKVGQWREWFTNSGDSFELQVPMPPLAPVIGRILIASNATQKVFEFNRDREQVWNQQHTDIQAIQGLPNGNILMASFGRRMILEIDREGNEVWKKTQLPGTPSSIQRLDNGNTLVVCSQPSGQVLELDTNGEIVWSVSPGRNPICARRLENGNTLVSLMADSKVVELDRDGEVVWELKNQHSAHGIRRLPNGNTLVAQAYQNTVVEYNKNKDRVWSKDGLGQVFDVERLPNGNTLVATAQGVVELDANGETVWKESSNTMCKAIHAY